MCGLHNILMLIAFAVILLKSLAKLLIHEKLICMKPLAIRIRDWVHIGDSFS